MSFIDALYDEIASCEAELEALEAELDNAIEETEQAYHELHTLEVIANDYADDDEYFNQKLERAYQTYDEAYWIQKSIQGDVDTYKEHIQKLEALKKYY